MHLSEGDTYFSEIDEATLAAENHSQHSLRAAGNTETLASRTDRPPR